MGNFRKNGIEVLLLSDRIDEWLTGHLTEYQGKKLVSVAKGALDLSKLLADQPETAAHAEEIVAMCLDKDSGDADRNPGISKQQRFQDQLV